MDKNDVGREKVNHKGIYQIIWSQNRFGLHRGAACSVDVSHRNIVTFNGFNSPYIDRVCGFLNQIHEPDTVKMLSENVICFLSIFL